MTKQLPDWVIRVGEGVGLCIRSIDCRSQLIADVQTYAEHVEERSKARTQFHKELDAYTQRVAKRKPTGALRRRDRKRLRPGWRYDSLLWIDGIRPNGVEAWVPPRLRTIPPEYVPPLPLVDNRVLTPIERSAALCAIRDVVYKGVPPVEPWYNACVPAAGSEQWVTDLARLMHHYAFRELKEQVRKLTDADRPSIEELLRALSQQFETSGGIPADSASASHGKTPHTNQAPVTGPIPTEGRSDVLSPALTQAEQAFLKAIYLFAHDPPLKWERIGGPQYGETIHEASAEYRSLPTQRVAEVLIHAIVGGDYAQFEGVTSVLKRLGYIRRQAIVNFFGNVVNPNAIDGYFRLPDGCRIEYERTDDWRSPTSDTNKGLRIRVSGEERCNELNQNWTWELTDHGLLIARDLYMCKPAFIRERPILEHAGPVLESNSRPHESRRPVPKTVDWSSYPIWTADTAHNWVSNKVAADSGGFKGAEQLAEYRKPARIIAICPDGRRMDYFGQVFYKPPNGHPMYLRSTIRKKLNQNPGNPG